MVDEQLFKKVKEEYGNFASWAAWKPPTGDDLTSNMEVEGLFDSSANSQLFNQLKNNVIMVGYNRSIPLDSPPPFHNFHDYSGSNINTMTLSNASKIRHAFTGTDYYGAYMTDLIKDCVETKSEKVSTDNIDEHVRIFREELEILQADKPTIIAFGGKVYSLLKAHLDSGEYSKLIKVPHYAHFGDGCRSHDGYRKKVLNEIASAEYPQNVAE